MSNPTDGLPPRAVKTLPMPPYRYQQPEWLKPRRAYDVSGVGQAIQLPKGDGGSVF